MRKHLTFFLTLFFFLSLASSCQRAGGEDPQASADSSIPAQEITSTTLPDDCENPPEGWVGGEGGDLPPGFSLDPQEPDKYLYVEEWHG